MRNRLFRPPARRRRLALACAGLAALAAPLAVSDAASATGGYYMWYVDIYGDPYILWCTTSGDPLITPTIGCVVAYEPWELFNW